MLAWVESFPWKDNTAATTRSKVPELQGCLIKGLLNLHLKKRELVRKKRLHVEKSSVVNGGGGGGGLVCRAARKAVL